MHDIVVLMAVAIPSLSIGFDSDGMWCRGMLATPAHGMPYGTTRGSEEARNGDRTPECAGAKRAASDVNVGEGVHRGHGKDPGLEADIARGVLDRTPIEAVHTLGSSQVWCISKGTRRTHKVVRLIMV